jgi:prevent-host-death family protein
MKIISDREFRNEPGKVRKELAGQNVVMTSRGRPYAVLLPVEEPEKLEEVLELADRLKAQMALSSVRGKSRDAGLDKLKPEDIDREIEQVRKQRKGS